MRFALSLLAALTLLYHLTVGCCDHHVHAGDVTPPAASHCHHGHVHHSHEHSSPSPAPAAPAHDDCHEAHCHMAVPVKVAPPDPPLRSLDLLNEIAALRLLEQSSCDHAHAHPPPRFGELRCHLVLQHFLI